MYNPESILPCGTMKVTSVMKFLADSEASFWKIDTATLASNYIATKGTLTASLMSSATITGDKSTYADNQAYTLTFTSAHALNVGGFIKIDIPQTFEMSSRSSAVAQFYVRDATNANHATINVANQNELYLIGQCSKTMPAGTVFTIRLGGLRNPRYLLT